MVRNVSDARAKAVFEGQAPLKLSAYALSLACRVPRTRIERLVREEIPVTPNTALRLARYFGASAEF